MEEKMFKYAEREVQIKKVNTFLCISTAVVFLLSYIVVAVSFMQGNRTGLFAGSMLVVMLATITISFVTLKRDSGNEKLRWYIGRIDHCNGNACICIQRLLYAFFSSYASSCNGTLL